MQEKQITVVAKFKAKTGMENRLREEIMALVAPTRAETGCLNYDLHQSLENKGDFVLYENWVSQEALDNHLKTPNLTAFLEKVPGILAAPVDISLWQMISSKN